METNLRPLTFGEILNQLFRLLCSHFKLFLGLALLPMTAFLLVYALFFAAFLLPVIAHFPAQPDPNEILRWFLPALLILTPLFMAIFSFYLAASIHAGLQANMGLTVTLRESYQVAWQRFGRYFWLLFLCYLIAFLPLLIVELLMFGGMTLGAMHHAAPGPAFYLLLPLEIILLVGAMVWGFIQAMRLSLAFPASLAEGITAREAIRRSGELTRGAKGRIFLVLIVIYAIGYAAELVGLLLLAAIIGVGALLMAAMQVKLLSVLGILGASLALLCFLASVFLWVALLWAAISSVLAILYHDQLLRKSLLTAQQVASNAPFLEVPRSDTPLSGGAIK